MKLRYLLLSLVLFPIASIFGASAAASTSASASAVPASEADTKSGLVPADAKQSAAAAAAVATNNESNVQDPTLASFIQWINARRCPPTCATKGKGSVSSWYPGCETQPLEFFTPPIGVDGHRRWIYSGNVCRIIDDTPRHGEHCDDQCLATIYTGNACPHMRQLAGTCFARNHARNREGRPYVNYVPGDVPFTLSSNEPFIEASLTPCMPKELRAIVKGYVGDRFIEIKLEDLTPHPVTQSSSTHTCTYHLDADSMVIARLTYNCIVTYSDSEKHFYTSNVPIAPISL